MDRIQECLVPSLGSSALNCRVLIQAHLKFLYQVIIYFNDVCMKFQETCTIFFFFFHRRIFKLWGSHFGCLGMDPGSLQEKSPNFFDHTLLSVKSF